MKVIGFFDLIKRKVLFLATGREYWVKRDSVLAAACLCSSNTLKELMIFTPIKRERPDVLKSIGFG